MRIGIVGAGAIGGYYATTLSAAGHEVTVLTRGEHVDTIRNRGIIVRHGEREISARPRVGDDAAILGECETVVVAVKSYGLSTVGPALASAAKAGADVVPLLNGVDIADRLAALGVPTERIVGGLARISVLRTAPGIIERKSTFDEVVVGELNQSAIQQSGTASSSESPRCHAIADAFASAGATARVSLDIALDLWRKFLFLEPMAASLALTRTTVGPLTSHPRGRSLLEQAIAETGAVGRASRIRFSADEEARTMREFVALPGHLRPSFAVDLERGGPTELDVLSATVSRLGASLGVPVPLHDAVTAAVAAATNDLRDESAS